jgi:hypothetical protein
VALALAACALLTLAAPAFAADAVFNPLYIISDATWRSPSMSVADIQAFLDDQPGPLKSLVTTDYVTPGGTNNYGIPWTAGMPAKSAAQIIGEAAQYWNMNPKVLLATLQKEQSLLAYYVGMKVTRHRSDGSDYTYTYTQKDIDDRLRKATGYGIYEGSTNTYPGFGNQVFNSARGYSQFESRYDWVPGMATAVQLLSTGADTTIIPLNAPTYGLYKYTPYFPQSLFWNVYVHYFEDPAPVVRTSLALSTSKSTVEFSEGYVLSGAIDPAFAGAPIVISYQRPGQTTWRSWLTLTSTADGRFSVSTRGWLLGTYTYRATFPGDTEYGVSPFVYETVTITPDRAATSLTMSIDKESVALSESYVLSGAIDPAFAGAPIVISYRRPGETTWRSWTTLATTADGRFSVSTRGYRSGTYTYRATFPGDATHGVARYVYDTVRILP